MLAFEGSEHVRAGDYARLVRAYGGFVNSGTSEDATFFQDTLPAEYMDLALRLEADRMRGLVLREPTLVAQRAALEAELKRSEQVALTRGLRGFLEAAFKRHPYRWSASGRLEDLPSIKLADVKTFYDTYYVPQNALLVVVGAVEEKAVRAAVQARFGGIAGGAAPAHPAAGLAEAEQKGARRVTAASSQLGFVMHGYRIPSAVHPSVNALQLLSLVMASGDSSLLHKNLVVDRKIAIQAGGQAMVRQDPGLFILLVAHDSRTASKSIDDALALAVAAAREKPLPVAEVERARRQLLSNFGFAIETVAGLAGHIGQSWVLTQDPNHFWKDAAEFEKLTPADLQKAAREHLIESNLTVVTIPSSGAKD
jgi:zinc protease